MQTLTETQLAEWLTLHPEWSYSGDLLSIGYKFKDFVEAFAFISKIAIEVERVNHHPTITHTYNKVHISMNTHEAGNKITNRDTELAEIITKRKG